MNIADKEQRIACFFAKLDAMLDITAQQLHERMEFQKTAFAKQFPLLMSALWMGCDKLKPNDDISSVINQGTLGIGFIGLAECLKALIGKGYLQNLQIDSTARTVALYVPEGSFTQWVCPGCGAKNLTRRGAPMRCRYCDQPRGQ